MKMIFQNHSESTKLIRKMMSEKTKPKVMLAFLIVQMGNGEQKLQIVSTVTDSGYVSLDHKIT